MNLLWLVGKHLKLLSQYQPDCVGGHVHMAGDVPDGDPVVVLNNVLDPVNILISDL